MNYLVPATLCLFVFVAGSANAEKSGARHTDSNRLANPLANRLANPLANRLANPLANPLVPGAVSVTNAWSRPLPPVSPNGAAYLTLRNDGSAPDRLVAVASPIAERAELHAHLHQDGLVKMRPVAYVTLPPAQLVALEPGGLHVMLFQLKAPLNAGLTYPLTLTFERAGTLEVTVKVQLPGATPSANRGKGIEHGRHPEDAALHKSSGHAALPTDQGMQTTRERSKIKHH